MIGPQRREFCSELSQANGEPLGATASRVEHWILVEYRGVWARRELDGSLLPSEVKEHLRAQVEALPRSRLLFVRKPERRRHGGYAVFYGRTTEVARPFRGLELSRYEELLGIDFAGALAGTSEAPGVAIEHPLLVVCTHGKRDPCCAKHGRPLYEALHEAADEDWVWQSTHVGGDRFAGNLVCLPEGLYFGRVGRLEALDLLAGYLAGRIDLEHYRGRCCYPFPVQAAELEVRRRTGETAVGSVRLDGVRRTDDGSWTVGFRVAGAAYEVEVVGETGGLTQLTCSATVPKRPRRFSVRSGGTPPGQAA